MKKYNSDITLIKESFDKSALRYVHFRSIENFILYIDDIKNMYDKSKIENYINEYFYEIKNTDGLITDEFSYYLYKNFISKIGIYFQKHLGFRVITRPSTFIPTTFVDILLFFTGIFVFFVVKLFLVHLTHIINGMLCFF